MTGGWNRNFLSSTETLVEEADVWVEVGDLPVAMWGLQGVSLNNNVLMTGNIIIQHQHIFCEITGGFDGIRSHHDFILQFNPEDGSWLQVGQLQNARSYHGVSVVNADHIIDYCN